MSKSVEINLRISEALHAAIRTIAVEEDRSIHSVIRELLSGALDDLGKLPNRNDEQALRSQMASSFPKYGVGLSHDH